jgi:hypothetical protein
MDRVHNIAQQGLNESPRCLLDSRWFLLLTHIATFGIGMAVENVRLAPRILKL